MSGAIVAASIGGAAALGGGILGAYGSNKAANTQASAANNAAQLNYQASQNALGFQKQQWDTTQNEMAPWLNSGKGALSNLDYLMGVTPQTANGNTPLNGQQMLGPGAGGSNGNPTSGLPTAHPNAIGGTMDGPSGAPGGAPGGGGANGGFGSLMQGWQGQFQAPTNLTEQNDPGYQARLQLGTDAIQRSAAAKGGVLSGGTGKALNTYAQDYASNEYGNVYNRAFNDYSTKYNEFQNNQANQFNRLSTMAGGGQTTAAQLGTLGQNAANSMSSNVMGTAAAMGQNYQNAAGATASGYMNGANALSGALGGVSNSLQNYYLLQQLQGGGGPGSSSPYMGSVGGY